MIVEKGQAKIARAVVPAEEKIFHGRAVSRGVAVGTVVCLHGRNKQFFLVEIEDKQIPNELERFRRAAALAAQQLEDLIIRPENAGDTKSKIFGAHILIVADSSFAAKIEDAIERRKINAEWAIKIVSDALVAEYKQIGDEHLRERYIDLQDVADRLTSALAGEKPIPIQVENAVVVAKEVKPSTLVELAEIKPKAIIAETGGWTSHTFILAREMNLPAVTGIDGILRAVETGETVVVDGYEGKVIFNPSEKRLREYKTAIQQSDNRANERSESFEGAVKTLDGREIMLRANADSPSVYVKAKSFGARGIGLYRSEFLFNQTGDFPSETEQITAYSRIADAAGEAGARIRIFDLSREQIANGDADKESNPALGLRAIRLLSAHSEQFRVQIRALLQAARGRKIDIVLPLVSDVSEIFLAKKILAEEKERLARKKIECGNPPVGAMIEVPSAVLMIEEIARAVDFLCLGTNDLVQYLLAVDRDNPAVADWFRSLHPAVIRAVRKVLTAADVLDTPVAVCGEMAGSPFYAPVLIGLGATDLSMNANSIARVARIVSGIAHEEARELAARIERSVTADEAEDLTRKYFAEKWSHLYMPEVSPERGMKKFVQPNS